MSFAVKKGGVRLLSAPTDGTAEPPGPGLPPIHIVITPSQTHRGRTVAWGVAQPPPPPTPRARCGARRLAPLAGSWLRRGSARTGPCGSRKRMPGGVRARLSGTSIVSQGGVQSNPRPRVTIGRSDRGREGPQRDAEGEEWAQPALPLRRRPPTLPEGLRRITAPERGSLPTFPLPGVLPPLRLRLGPRASAPLPGSGRRAGSRRG